MDVFELQEGIRFEGGRVRRPSHRLSGQAPGHWRRTGEEMEMHVCCRVAWPRGRQSAARSLNSDIVLETLEE